MIGLLAGRDMIQLFGAKQVRDSFGMTTVRWRDPIEVACSPQWVQARQENNIGLAPDSDVIVFSKTWGFPAQSRFFWQGKTFEQVGEAMFFYGSKRTQHFEVRAKLIATEEVDPRYSA